MLLRSVLRAQAAYYIATGLFPLVDMESFERITGPKRDRWLVRLIGLLACAIGASIATGVRERPAPETKRLSALSAAAFAAIELTYGLRGEISAVYVADAVFEVAVASVVLGSWSSTSY